MKNTQLIAERIMREVQNELIEDFEIKLSRHEYSEAYATIERELRKGKRQDDIYYHMLYKFVNKYE